MWRELALWFWFKVSHEMTVKPLLVTARQDPLSSSMTCPLAIGLLTAWRPPEWVIQERECT